MEEQVIRCGEWNIHYCLTATGQVEVWIHAIDAAGHDINPVGYIVGRNYCATTPPPSIRRKLNGD